METTNTLQPNFFKPSTDRKPLVITNFLGGYNNCLSLIHHSIKPINGVLKFEMVNWKLFPTTPEQAKGLALKWSKSIEKRKDFVNKTVVIFFHLDMKTIRVEVKDNTQL
jgi:hypothetical protein